MARDKEHLFKREALQSAILEMKQQTDLYRAELRDKLAGGRQMSSHSSDLKHRYEQQQEELEAAREERAAMLEEEQELLDEERRLKEQLESVKIEKDKLAASHKRYCVEQEQWELKQE